MEATSSISDSRLEKTEWTSLKTRYGSVQISAFRLAGENGEHFALLKGEMSNGVVVRLHSECLTGDVFGSLHCDCGFQLQSALQEITSGGGLLLYLRQEGRGIGLLNKIRAYKLQESGINTLDANLQLGLPVEARGYSAAAEFLRSYSVQDIILLTNSPDKIEKMSALGIRVSERRVAVGMRTEENSAYLDAKKDLLGHTIEH